MYTFLNNNNIIYNLQFGFRQHYSTSHALINITENIRKALDEGNTDCWVFVDLQKAFDTVDHQILLAKLNHYGIHGVSNDWFKSYLSNHNQYVSINGYDSGLAAINCKKVRLYGKRLYPTESVKYLEVKIDANLNWQCQVNDFSVKLNKANALLFIIRKQVSPKILRSIYLAIFESQLSYCSIVWAQNFRTILQIAILQKKGC